MRGKQFDAGHHDSACAHFSEARACIPLGVMLALPRACCSPAAPFICGRTPTPPERINVYPANYKSDILGAMHAYLDNPTGIREAAIGEPALKTKAAPPATWSVVRFNGKKGRGNEYAGAREIAAEFMVGRFNQFIENIKDLCAGTTYTPFPELQNLPP